MFGGRETMGNRAHIIFWHRDRDEPRFSPAVYLHWNGGPESVYGFLEELDRREVRADQEYEAARFVQIVGEFFDNDGEGGLSLGIVNGPKSDTPSDLEPFDHGDNGVYLVDRVKGRTVRRFTDENNDRGLQEWPAEKVERERLDAERHEYRDGFREFFRELAARKEARRV